MKREGKLKIETIICCFDVLMTHFITKERGKKGQGTCVIGGWVVKYTGKQYNIMKKKVTMEMLIWLKLGINYHLWNKYSIPHNFGFLLKNKKQIPSHQTCCYNSIHPTSKVPSKN